MRPQNTTAAAVAVCISLSLALACGTSAAQTKKKAPPPPAKPAFETPPPAAPQAQIDAAERVYYGLYECEFKQAIDISMNPKYAAYVDVKHGKQSYMMKPVVSATGAIRLEDVKGQTLMVQIANKSMLLDVQAGRRIVDECITAKQRELIDAARQARAAEGGASAPQTPNTLGIK